MLAEIAAGLIWRFVYDGEVVPALHAGCEVELHVVAKIIEAELVIRAVSDVGRIGGLSLEIVHVVLDAPDFQTDEAVNLSHPFGVTRREIVINCDHVNTATCQGVQICGQRGHQSLPFARPHFSDLALVQNHAAD